MKKLVKLCGLAAATLLLFLVIAVLAFYHLIRVGEFRRFLISELERQTELKVQLGEADLDMGLTSGIGFRDLTLSEPAAPQAAITAERITVRVALLPLLHRNIVLNEIVLFKPKAQMIRDPQGRIALLEKLLNLPLLQPQSSEFRFDLRSLHIRSGDIGLLDQRGDGPPVTLRLHNADLDIDRIRGPALRNAVQDLLKRTSKEPQGPALQFSVTSIVEKDRVSANLRGKGRVLSYEGTFDPRNAWWILDLDLVEIPATLLSEYAARHIPVKSISGHLAQQLHIEGRASENFQLSGDVEFRQLGMDAPELFSRPLDMGDGRVSFVANWSPGRVLLSRLNFRSTDIKFSAQGEIRSLNSNDTHLQLNFSSLPMPMKALRRVIPFKLIASPELERFATNLEEGEWLVRRAGINATTSEMRNWRERGLGNRLWFDAEVRNVTANIGVPGALPIRGVQGNVSLNKGIVAFSNLRGTFGNSRLASLEGTYQASTIGEPPFDIRARGDLDLAELREQLKLGVFASEAAKIALSVQELSGRARAELAFSRVAKAPVQMQGKLAIANATLRKDDLLLTELRGDVNFSPQEIKGEKLRGLLSGSPVQIDVAVKDYGSEQASFDVAVESPGMRAGVLTNLLLSSGSMKDAGLVRGAIRYRGPLEHKEGRMLTGVLDFTGVQVMPQPLLQPLREFSGRIKIDETGIDFQNVKGLLVGVPASFSGRWRYAETPRLIFDFAAPNLDVTYLLSQIDPETSEFYGNLVAQGRIAVDKGRLKNFEFGELRTTVALDRRVWRLTDLSARAAGGVIQGVTTVDDKPDTLEVITSPKIQGVPVQSFLRWFNTTTTEMTGRVTLTGNFETVGKDDNERKRNLSGAFALKIEDGLIRRLRILVQLLNLLDLSRWFTLQLPDLAKEGIRFRAVSGDFKVTNGVFFTENLLVDSDDLRMTGSGRIDVAKDELDFLVAVRPFAGIDTVMNNIPLLGRGIAAIKNSFLVASFHIRGSIDNPIITPAPLGTITEWFWGVLGIPKNVIGLGGKDKTDEPKEHAK